MPLHLAKPGGRVEYHHRCALGTPATGTTRGRIFYSYNYVGPDPELQATMCSLTIRPRAMSGAEFFAALKSQAPTVENILAAAGMKKS